MKKNRSLAYAEFIEELKRRCPGAEIEDIPPFAGADYSVRVTAPSRDDMDKVMDVVAELSYDAFVKHKASILASVTYNGPIPAGA